MLPAGAGLGSNPIRDYILLATSEAHPVIRLMPSYFTYDLKTAVASYKDCLRCLNREWNLVVVLVMVSSKYVCR